MDDWRAYNLDYAAPLDTSLQNQLESIDASLRKRHGIGSGPADVGLLDLKHPRLAMVQPDRLEYGASVAKIGILLAYFDLHPDSAGSLPSVTLHELGLMIKTSSNEMATKFSRQLGLSQIQEVLNAYNLYDAHHGGGIWVGKHYGENDERIGDPLGNHSHTVTVRQLLRFYLLLEQDKLVSPEASRVMREIFESPAIPHDHIKFVAGLEGRNVRVRRKWGSWEDWLHDTAVITGPDRHYILVGLTNHPQGDDYLVDLARAVDDLLIKK